MSENGLPETSIPTQPMDSVAAKRDELRRQLAELDAQSPQPKLELARNGGAVKLDLACGQTCREGFEGVDLLAPNVKHKIDLWKFPWPWKDDSVDEIFCSHFIEHIPAREIVRSDIDLPKGVLNPSTLSELYSRFEGQDMFLAFFDECWRILKKTSDPKQPAGTMTVVCPSARSNRAFQDPTHRRFIVEATFAYLAKDWRVSQKLDHYRVNCNFGSNVGCSTDSSEAAYTDEVKARRYGHYWNVVMDWHAMLIALK